AEPGVNAQRMLTLDLPTIDWVHIARGHGVNGSRAATATEFAKMLQASLAQRGPHLIEAVL
ncbi:MAG TPA: thiamine pyrophosphate-dependent enzyme, partial [Burkholderiaceae bacterium]